ncbi:MAG: phage terminase large subunit, partial [Collinsella sp.]
KSFDSTDDTIRNRESGGRLYFKGITASRGNQTARLKSIPHLKMWVNDESEELVSKQDFDTIDDSVREKGATNQVWLVGNAADVSHWIYNHFYLERGVPYDYNGRVDDCWYIHSTYKSNRQNLSPSFLDKIRLIKERNYEDYEHRYLGKWLARKEGLIYHGWIPIEPSEWPVGLPQWYCVDWGYSSDPGVVIRMAYDPMTGRLFVRQVAYRRKMLVPDIADEIVRDGASIGYKPYQCRTYCDPARPDNRDQLRVGWGIDAVNGVNKDKVGRIGYLQGFQVYYIGEDIANEVTTYSFQPSKTDPGLFTDKPQDGNDHAMDAIQYGVTHLRNMGVVNQYGMLGGEK